MRCRSYSYRDWTKLLEQNGYTLRRTCKSSHVIYSNGVDHITVKRGKINKMIARRMIKEHNLKQIDK